MKFKRFQLAAVITFVLAAGMCYSCRGGGIAGDYDSLPLETDLWAVPGESGTQSVDLAAAGASTSAETEMETAVCCVHICGEVVSPGVYELEEGSRVFEAVRQAGGFTEAAAQDYLNLAETVCDGMKLVVPAAGEVAAESLYGETGAGGAAGSGKVDLNTAGKEELMTLKGIGSARAEDILRYREEHGGFQKIEDIMKVSGIKEAAFQKIKDDITVRVK